MTSLLFGRLLIDLQTHVHDRGGESSASQSTLPDIAFERTDSEASKHCDGSGTDVTAKSQYLYW